MKVKDGLYFKVFSYSALLASIVGIIVTLYFIFILPGVYANQKQKEELRNIELVQREMLRDFNSKEFNKNSFTAVKINPANHEIKVNVGGTFMATIEYDEPKIDEITNMALEMLKNREYDEKEFEKIDFEYFNKYLPDNFKIDILIDESMEEEYTDSSNSTITLRDDMIIASQRVASAEMTMLNYIALSNNNGELVFSAATLYLNTSNELSSSFVVILPAIVLIGIVIVLVLGTYFSRRITKPINELASYASLLTKDETEIKKMTDNNEIAILNETLNDLYLKLKQQVKDIDAMNNELIQKNKNQELFLIASSHQLKTPITAAMLVVESMIDNIGKYQDYPTYLGVVNDELLIIKEMIDEIISISKNVNLVKEENKLELNNLLTSLIKENEITINEKELIVMKTVSKQEIIVNEQLFKIILRVLIENMILHSKAKSELVIDFNDGKLTFKNEVTSFDSELFTSMFEPFVKSNESRGHGLGLYLVKQYCEVLDIKIEVKQEENVIIFCLTNFKFI